MSTSDVAMDDGVYTEEDMKRSEEFKERGNTYFKGKIQYFITNYIQRTSSNKVLICTQRRYSARYHLERSLLFTAIGH
jgi:hypothetical protein